MSNALSAIGFSLGEDVVADIADTNGDGTGAAGLKRAARKLGAEVEVISETSGERAFFALLGFLADGWAAVLCTNKGEHWVTAFGVHGGRVLIFDPGAATDNIAAFSMQALLEIWTCKGKKSRYAVVVKKRD